MAESLGKYEIRGTLGRGAMGTVLDGWDPIIARRVAIKTVPLPDADDVAAREGLERFRREAQAAGRLTHPNVVGVFDYGETDSIAYIVMEFVEGRTLKSALDRQERFGISGIVGIMDDLLAGLAYSHARGVIHRDIKPANLMLTAEGRVKITDFGIARIESAGMTQVGTIMGTPAYMSPEQFMGQAVDARTDVYSSGALLYQLLTGERPFEGGLTAIMHKVLNTEPPRPSEISVTVPRAFDHVVSRAMSKRPADRYADAPAFAAAIRAAAAAEPESAAAAAPDEVIETMVMPGGLTAAVPPVMPPPGPPPGPPPSPSGPSAMAAAPSAPPVPPAPAIAGAMAARQARGGRRGALLAGVAVVVLALAGGGWWLSSRPGQTAPGQPQTAESVPPAAAGGTSGTRLASPSTDTATTQTPPPPTAPAKTAASPPAAAGGTPAAHVAEAPLSSAPAQATVANSAPPPEPAKAAAAPATEAGSTPAARLAETPASPASATPTATPPAGAAGTAAAPAPVVAAQAPPAASPPAASPPVAPQAAAAPAASRAPAATASATGTPAAPTPAAREASATPAATTAGGTEAPPPASPGMPAPVASAAATAAAAPAAPAAQLQVASAVAPEALRTAVAAALAGLPCTLPAGGISPAGDGVRLAGLVGAGEPEAALHRALRDAPGPVAWDVRSVPDLPAYCQALDLLRPIAARFGGAEADMRLSLADGRTRLLTDDPIRLRVRMPDFAAHLRIDYLSSDGSVYHVPPPGGADRLLHAGEVARPGPASHDGEIGTVNPPYGTDLIIAVASSSPLELGTRKAEEPAEAYLRDLQAAVEQARRKGQAVAGAVLVLDTAAR